MNKIQSKLYSITPEMASDILDRSAGQRQRPLDHRVVGTYAKELSSGSWKITGESITLDENGVCINGQHRLNAIILSGVNMETFMSVGVQNDAFHYIDSGKGRTTGDIVKIAGYKNARILAAVARNAMIYKKRGVGTTALWNKGSNIVQSHTVLDFININPSIVEYIDAVYGGDFSPLYMDKGMHVPAVFALMYLLWVDYPIDVERFMIGVAQCENMGKDDVRMMLSNLIIKEKLKDSRKAPKEEILSVWVQAWNTFSTEMTRKKLTLSQKIPIVKFLSAESVILPKGNVR